MQNNTETIESKLDKEIEQVISQIVNNMFFTEPILFRTFCNHELCRNPNLQIPFRSGKMRLEYSPTLLFDMAPPTIRKHLKTELIRIVMGHPYLRCPDPFDAGIAYSASNITINQTDLKQNNLEPNMNFEYYYFELYKKKNNNNDNNDSEADLKCSGNQPGDGDMRNSEGEQQSGNQQSFNDNESQNSDNDNSQDSDNSKGDGGQESDEQQNISDGGQQDSDNSKGDGGQQSDDQQSNVDSDNSQSGVKSQSDGEQQPGEQQPVEQINTNDKTQIRDGGHQYSHNKQDRETQQISNDDFKLSEIQEIQAVELWEENDDAKDKLQEIVNLAINAGIYPGFSTQKIKMEEKVEIPEYEKAIRIFKTSVSAKNRRLTRMRPSRRSGFLHMGSHYDYQPYSILVAIDTSGSISDISLSAFYGAMKKIFKKGIEHIDVIQFDKIVQNTKPVKFSATKKNFKVKGRGGTDFQPVIDYASHTRKNYDGLIIFTDGVASEPVIPAGFNLKILWIIHSLTLLNMKIAAPSWMYKSGFVTFLLTQKYKLRFREKTVMSGGGGG